MKLTSIQWRTPRYHSRKNHTRYDEVFEVGRIEIQPERDDLTVLFVNNESGLRCGLRVPRAAAEAMAHLVLATASVASRASMPLPR